MVHPTLTLPVVKKLEDALRNGRIAHNINLACFVVIYYDWITTLDLEVELVWKSKWSKLTASYFLTRYLTLTYTFMVLYYQFGNNLSVSTCTKLYASLKLTILVTSFFSWLLVTIRTVAIWEHRRWTKIVAYGLYAVAFALVLVFSVISIKHAIHIKLSATTGCIQKFGSSYQLHMIIIFIAVTVFDTVTLGLLLVRGVSLWWWGRDSRLFRTIYGDGLTFCLYVNIMSIANLILIFGPPDHQSLLVLTYGAICPLLACRIILHLRMRRDEPPMIGMSEDNTTAPQSRISAIEFRTA